MIGWLLAGAAALELLSRSSANAGDDESSNDPDIPATDPAVSWYVKDSTVELNLVPALNAALPTIAAVVQQVAGGAMIITSGSEPAAQHADGSKHYSGKAIDIRVRDFAQNVWYDLARAIQNALGAAFYVLLEYDPDHIHVQLQA